MKTLQFTTTLKCSGCVEKIKPDFDTSNDIESWELDLQTNPKVLTVKGENITEEKIKDLLEKSGYKGTLIR